MSSKITLKVSGEQMGCIDMGAPETCTEKQLSLVHDLLFTAQQLEESATGVEQLTDKIFKMLPDNLKLEFNYSNWKYHA